MSRLRVALADVVLGRRGVVKSADLWLPLALVFTTRAAGARPLDAGAALEIFGAVACWVLVSILANDVTDREGDLAAGKPRWIATLPRGLGLGTLGLLTAAGAAGAALGGGAALAVYLGALALALAYSIRPVRMKERGLLGMATYAVAAALAYAVFPWVWCGADAIVLAVAAPAVLLDKWVNLHFHQVIDWEGDVRSGQHTYATAVGLERARRTLGWIARLTSAWFLLALAFSLLDLGGWRWPIGGAVLFVLGLAGLYVARAGAASKGGATHLTAELPWHYLGGTYAVLRVLPLLLFARLALDDPRLWLVVLLSSSLVALESWQSYRYRLE